MFGEGEIEIITFCAKEVHRQGDSALFVPGMIMAWNDAIEVYELNADVMFRWNGLIKNRETIRYRTTPVYFASGGSAVNWIEIPDAMDRWFDYVNERCNVSLDDWDELAELTKSFLDIHPFEDGNGRMAAIIYNWLNLSLEDDPIPLPDFYKVKGE